MDQPGRVSAGLRQLPHLSLLWPGCTTPGSVLPYVRPTSRGLSSLSIPCRHCLPRLLSSLPCHSLLHSIPLRENANW